MSKTIKRISAAVMLTVVMICSLIFNAESAFAYNKDVSEGICVVAFYVENGYYCVADSNGQLSAIQEFGSGVISTGTGFFVGEDGEDPKHLVTNCHVVNDFLEAGEGKSSSAIYLFTHESYGPIYLYFEKCELRVYYDEKDYDAAYIVAHGDVGKVDLAILEIGKSTNKRHSLKIKVPDEDMLGETVYTVGYPGAADNELTDASRWAVDDATVSKGAITKFARTSGTGVQTIQTDANIQHGNSGGPMVDEDGNVIGINTWYYTEDGVEINSYAINAEELVDMLENNNVPYATAGKSGFSVSPLLIGIIAGVVLLLIIIIVVIIAASGKKKKEDASRANIPTPGPQMNPQMRGQMPNGMPMNGMPGATMGAGMQQMNGGMRPAQPAQPAKKPMIRSMSTQHNGATFAIGNQPILIGRDTTNCKIVFREGTAGVSGRHCSVEYKADMNEFLVTDLRSTYGTYLMNGQRLQPNVPFHCKPGESFYVGDKANVLCVEVR